MISIPSGAMSPPSRHTAAWYAAALLSLATTIAMLYGVIAFLMGFAGPTTDLVARADDDSTPDLAIAALGTIAGGVLAMVAAVHAAGSRRLPADQRVPWVLALLMLWPAAMPAYCWRHARNAWPRP